MRLSPAPLRRARPLGARALAAAAPAAFAVTLAAAVAACTDARGPLPTAPVRTEPTGARRPDAVSGGASTVTVQVPVSMRAAPFDVPRTLTVPGGYAVSVYARVGGARFMAAAPNGDLLVSNPGAGTVYRVRPGADGADPSVTAWATGLYRPHDVVFHAVGGTMYVYVSEGDKVARYAWNPDAATGQGRQVVVRGLPSASNPELHGVYGHELKNIALGPDDRLYVSIASTCNACVEDTQSDPVRGAVYVYDADGSNGRLFARGLRNAEGLAFVPGTNVLWAVVNNRDNTAYPFHQDVDGDGRDDYGRVIPAYVDDHPPDEFTRVSDGANYGWPFCNPNPDTGLDDMPFDRDVQYNPGGGRLDCATAATRVDKGIPAHSAALGLTFFQGTRVPVALQNGAAVALHGSWNRTTPTGYKVVWFPWIGGASRPGAQQDLVTGWLTGGSAWGRPVDVAVDSAGAIFVSDDQSGTIYRLTQQAPTPTGALVGRQSGLCLDVGGESREWGAATIVWDCWGGANQQWSVPPVGETGEVRVYGSTMCLDAAGNTGHDGDPITIWGCWGGPNQQWTHTAAGELRGINGKCVDVAGQGTAQGTRVILWGCWGGDNQRWDVR